jgi:hypothetical protein
MPKKSLAKKATAKNNKSIKTSKEPIKSVDQKVTPAKAKRVGLHTMYGRRAVSRILTVAALLLLLSGWLWWQYIYQSPQNVFAAMLQNGLSSPGVTKTVNQTSQDGSLKAVTQLAFGSQNYAHSVSTVSQPGTGSQEQSVTTETIGTLSAQYVRYSNINTGVRNDGKKPDFSKVQDVWGKADVDSSAPPSSNRMLVEGIIGTVPVANLSASQRQELLKLINDNKVYATDYAVIKKKEAGRNLYVYSVKINPQAYIKMLQTFTAQVGLGAVDGLDSASYANAQPINADFSVDPVSHQLVKISYKDGSDRVETYESYGAVPNINLPTNPIPLAELQQRVQQIQ